MPLHAKDYFISKPRFSRLLRLEPQNAIPATVIPVELSVPTNAFPRSDDRPDRMSSGKSCCHGTSSSFAHAFQASQLF